MDDIFFVSKLMWFHRCSKWSRSAWIEFLLEENPALTRSLLACIYSLNHLSYSSCTELSIHRSILSIIVAHTARKPNSHLQYLLYTRPTSHPTIQTHNTNHDNLSFQLGRSAKVFVRWRSGPHHRSHLGQTEAKNHWRGWRRRCRTQRRRKQKYYWQVRAKQKHYCRAT